MGEVMQETLMMIPDCHRRLVAAHAELSQLLETEAELNVGATSLELLLPGAARPFVEHFPRRVCTDDGDATESAKFSKKTGRLTLVLKLAG